MSTQRSLSDSFSVLFNNTVLTCTKKQFTKIFSCHDIIRFHKEDFQLIDEHTSSLTHFNLECSDHQVGKKYLLLAIHKGGFFDGTHEQAPILCLEAGKLFECIQVHNHVSYEHITQDCFKHSLHNIQSVPELQAAILHRYKYSMSHLSDEQKLSLGVGITHLQQVPYTAPNPESIIKQLHK